jgi:hypothetical protein
MEVTPLIWVRGGRADEISVWRVGWLRYKSSIRVVRLRVRVMVTRERKTRVSINLTFNF